MNQSPWKSMALNQYTIVDEKVKKATNKMQDAQRKIASGDSSPETQESYLSAKADLEAYSPSHQQLQSELTT